MFFNNRRLFSVVALSLVATAFMVSCNKPFPDTLTNDFTPGENINSNERKVLLIVVDGAVGAEVQAALPPTLNSLTDFSIYSWEGLSTYVNKPVTNAMGWSTLLTGTNSNKHNVTGADFAANNFATYPTLFTRLKQERPNLRTAAFTASPEVLDNLSADATEKKSFAGDDAAVKEAVKEELATKNSALVMAQFNDVDAAGQASSYDIGSTEYKNAILRVDAYIGEILTAMRDRPSFDNENWMVLITSNKGSNTEYIPSGAAQWSAFMDTRHNTFFFSYNPRFKSTNPTKPGSFIPYMGTSPYYNGTQSNSRRAKALDGGTTYDIGSTGSYTIQCKVKIPAGNYYYPAFLSKRASFTGGVVGWVFFLEANYWMVNFGQAGLGNRQIRGHAISDGQWHTLTVVIKQEGTARNVYTYTDGVLYPGISDATRNIANYGNLNSPQPLTVGNLPPDNTTGLGNYLVTDIRIYNEALSDAYIANNYCKIDVEPADPYISNLLGFWPSTEVTSNKEMLDKSGNGHNLTIESYNPGSFNDITPGVCPAVSESVYKTVPNSVDVAVQIFQWLGIAVPPGWNLDGRNWIPTYSDLGG